MKFINVNKSIIKVWIFTRFLFLLFLFCVLLSIIYFIDNKVLKLSLMILCILFIIIQSIYAFIIPYKEYKNYMYLLKPCEIVLNRKIIFNETTIIPINKITKVEVSNGLFISMFNLKTLRIYINNHFFELQGLEESICKVIKKSLGFEGNNEI